jgi:hypothetical protein
VFFHQPIVYPMCCMTLLPRILRVISIIDGLIFTVFEGNYLSLTFRK